MSAYPSGFLYLPVQLLERLPPQLQSYDAEYVLVVQAVLALPPCTSISAPVYTLPLSLFALCLLAQQRSSSASSTTASFLSHFLFLWILSVPLDAWWLWSRSGTTGSLVVFCIGAGMVLKVVSGGLVGQLLLASSEGRYDVGGISASSGGAGGWMSRAAASVSGGVAGGASIGAGGLWSVGGNAQGAGANRGDIEEQLPGGYSNIYDEDEEAIARERARAGATSSNKATRASTGAYGAYADEDDEGDDDTGAADAPHVIVPPPKKTHNGGYTSID